MKKLILSTSVLLGIFLLTCCGNKDKQTKQDNDKDNFVIVPDANFKAYLLENFDTDKDGKISLTEAAAVIEIDCSHRKIAALDGIEKFVNLERLICNDNKLDELELRYNKKINRLVCTNNLDILNIYFAKSSPLSKEGFEMPKDGATVNPVDESKVVFDNGRTNFILCFND